MSRGLIIFFGPPGAGKSVQAGLLAAELGYTTVSTGALLRSLNDPSLKETMSTGELVDPAFVNQKIAELITKYSPDYHLIIDGTPRSEEQAKWLVEYAKENSVPIRKFIHLQSSLETAKSRLLKRGRFDDQDHVIEKRYSEYVAVKEPLISVFIEAGVGIAEINGDQDLATVRDQILEQVA